MDDLKLYASDKEDLQVLVREVKAYSCDIRMEFGMDKCAYLVCKKGKQVESEGVVLPSGEKMKEVDEDGYKYLGVLQGEMVMNSRMKGRVRDEYYRRVKALAKSKLYAKNMVDGINAWAIGVVRYSAGILDWSAGELQAMDVKTRKILTMNGAFNRKSSTLRLYMKRKDGGRGLMGVQNCVDGEKRSLGEYVSNSEERLVKVVRDQGMVLVREVETKGEYDRRVDRERKEGLKGKKVHGRFMESVKDVASDRSYDWMKSGYLDKATESYICAAQEQALMTRWRERYIHKDMNVDPKCRVCGEYDETVNHVASGCSQLAKKQYLLRHDRMGKRVHWELCKKYGVECSEVWYKHVPEKVMMNRGKTVEIWWDKTYVSARRLKHNRPDVLIHNYEDNEWTLIDFACPMDVNIERKETEKIVNYQQLANEIRRANWRSKVEVVPIVIGETGIAVGAVKQGSVPDTFQQT